MDTGSNIWEGFTANAQKCYEQKLICFDVKFGGFMFDLNMLHTPEKLRPPVTQTFEDIAKMIEARQVGVENIASRLRDVVKEHGEPPKTCVIISPFKLGPVVCGFQHIYCATIASPILGECFDFKMCRTFEEG